MKPNWSCSLPSAAVVLLTIGLCVHVGAILTAPSTAALIGAVISAVHHVEVVAHKLGVPSARSS